MGYRPRVVIGSFTIKWFPEKYGDYLKSGNKEKIKHVMKFVQEKRFENESIALNDQNQWVSQEMKQGHIRRLFSRYGIKYDKDNIYLLRDVKVISESKANYEL